MLWSCGSLRRGETLVLGVGWGQNVLRAHVGCNLSLCPVVSEKQLSPLLDTGQGQSGAGSAATSGSFSQLYPKQCQAHVSQMRSSCSPTHTHPTPPPPPGWKKKTMKEKRRGYSLIFSRWSFKPTAFLSKSLVGRASSQRSLTQGTCWLKTSTHLLS